jgi:hypothetical protein
MLSFILQLGGFGVLIFGITVAAASDSINADSKEGKFEF